MNIFEIAKLFTHLFAVLKDWLWDRICNRAPERKRVLYNIHIRSLFHRSLWLFRRINDTGILIYSELEYSDVVPLVSFLPL